ncbi:hypothetical protein Tco_0851895 [Tanacetum coccineum]
MLPIPLHAPSTSRIANIPEADTPPRKRLIITAHTPRVEVGQSSAAAAARQLGSTMARRVDHSFVDTVDTRVRDTKRRTMAAIEAQEDRATMRAKIEIMRRERLAYEQESIETRQALARLVSRAKVIENQAPRPLEYVPDPMELEDHIPVYIPEPEHPEDLVPAEDEAPIKPYITEVEESSVAAAARLPGSTMARRVDHSFVDTVDTRVRDTERRTMAAVEEAQDDRGAVRAEIEILKRERLAYEQESIETH